MSIKSLPQKILILGPGLSAAVVIASAGLALVGLAITCLSGCSFKKAAPISTAQGATGLAGAPNMSDPDWQSTTTTVNGVTKTVRTLSAAKLAQIRQNFGAPELTSVSVPESGGFEIYYASGFTPIEGAAFIQPKIFISTNTENGSILGYKTAEKDEAGEPIVAVSIPVALVDGLVSAVPIVASQGSAVSLPERYKIKDVAALKKAVAPRELRTMTVCPKVFRLMFEGHEYRAPSPFENLSNCPLNQFFRIVFKAPVKEMKKLLETAATSDDAVSIEADLTAQFVTPRARTEVSMPALALRAEITQLLSTYEVRAKAPSGGAYGASDIEAAVTDAVFETIRAAGAEPEFSEGMPRFLSGLIDNYFTDPFRCAPGGICRALRERPAQVTNIQYGWTVAETLGTPIETVAVTALGAVANSSDFTAKPAWSVLTEANRPKWFGGKSMQAIASECTVLSLSQYPLMPGMDESELPYIKGYCAGIIAIMPSSSGMAREPEDPGHGEALAGLDDGYFPLGANTTVYPGAWLKIELEEISEFTTAKTKTNKDGSVVIESEVKDMMEGDPTASRTSCVEGNQTACVKYAMKEIAVRQPSGDPVVSDLPCKKGDEGCTCVKNQDGKESPSNGSEETCTKKLYQFQKVMDFECDSKDQFDYCPYYRTDDEVIDYEREWDCQNVKVDSRTTFLCFGSCSEEWKLICQAKTLKPITAKRQHLNCKENDPFGTQSREQGCRHPKYLCEEWATRCSHYSVNEAFQIIHEEVAPKWRPYAITKGEYPAHFEDQIDLKFVSPKGTVSDCPLNKFGRFFKGNTLFIKIPDENNSEVPCGTPLWTGDNTKALYLPKVYIRNRIKHAQMRLCGRTEYSYLTDEVPVSGGKSIIPSGFSKQTKVTIGPVPNSCRAPNPIPINSDLWFVEVPPVRFSGRVSVLGRVLESIVAGGGQ